MLRLCVRFKYASFYLRLQSFQSLFGSLFSIAVGIYFSPLRNIGAKLFRIWKTCHQAHKQHKYPHASFVCMLQAYTLPFISVFARFARCLNLFQSITKHCTTGAKLFCIWNFLSAAFFGIHESSSRALLHPFYLVLWWRVFRTSSRGKFWFDDSVKFQQQVIEFYKY